MTDSNTSDKLCPSYADHLCFSWPLRDEAVCPVNGEEA